MATDSDDHLRDSLTWFITMVKRPGYLTSETDFITSASKQDQKEKMVSLPCFLVCQFGRRRKKKIITFVVTALGATPESPTEPPLRNRKLFNLLAIDC